MTRLPVRLTLGIALPVLLLSAGVGPFLIPSTRLPGRIAVHFSAQGAGESTAPTWFVVAVLVCGNAWVIVQLVRLAFGSQRPIDRPTPYWLLRWPAAANSGLTRPETSAAAVVAIVDAAIPAVVWAARGTSRMVPIWWAAVCLVSGIVVWALASFLVGRLPEPSQLVETSQRNAVNAEPITSARETSPVLAAFALLGLFVALTRPSHLSLLAALVLAVTSAVVLGGSVVRIEISDASIEARAVVGWPRLSVPLRDIDDVSITRVSPLSWGGWGIRGSRGLFKRKAIILHGGDALQIRLHNGVCLVITARSAPSLAAGIRARIA